MKGVNEIILFVLLASVLTLAIAVFLAVLAVRGARRKPRKEDRSEMGFVVETFQDMVVALKEKEKELEVLRKNAEDKAETIEGYNENILQSVPSGVISLDTQGNIVKMNSSASRILGIEAREAAGKPGGEVFRTFDLGGGPSGQRRFLSASGKSLWLAYRFTPLFDSRGETIGRLLVLTDITELKALESQAALRQRLSSLGEMSAGMAHELRNSMGVISGYMRMLSKKTGGDLKDNVDAVFVEVEAMDRIINEFLSFASPPGLNTEEFALGPFVEDCLQGLMQGREHVEAKTDIDHAISVQADRVLLRQAFTNLLNNSLDALSDGGKITVSARARDKDVEISFRDNGHGIEEGIREKVFLPFFTTKEKGTGLGLAVVHSIVTNHGGTVEVSGSGDGTEFLIRLPLVQGR